MPRIHPSGGSSSGGGGSPSTTSHAFGTGALGVAYSGTPITVSAPDGAIAIPDRCYLSFLDLVFDTVAGGATSVTLYLSEDNGGVYGVSTIVEISLLVGAAVGRPEAVIDLSRYYHRSTLGGVAATLYLWAKTNLGTVNVQARIRFVP
jgi:hypothetical protein